MSWLNKTNLESETIRLVPLDLIHEQDLQEATKDGELWNLWFTSVPKVNDVKIYISQAIEQMDQVKSLPFAIIDKATNKAIGSSRYCNVDAKNKRLEIGYTWYAKSYQRSAVNTEAKLLLLAYAFEELSCIAVEFRTNWHNQASKNAIARLGAKQDGILRQHQTMDDGTYRDTVVFSILNSEWLSIKKGLTLKLALHKK